MLLSLFRGLILLLLFVSLNGAAAGVIIVSVVYDKLPTLQVLLDYRPRLPMRIYSADGELMGEFGEERRDYTEYSDFPPDLVNALLATEDVRFFEHYGVDFVGIVRAAAGYAAGRREGASTITMQVARNFYLRRDRTLVRKMVEVLLALKIESLFDKRQILERYMNQIYLGHGSYGFAAAAREYYDKTLDELTMAEIAVLSGLPKAPSRLNPRSYPERAKERQKHVLGRMLAVGLLDEQNYLILTGEALPPLAVTARRLKGNADFAAEEVRKTIYQYFGDAAYERGINVYTTIRSPLQQAAVEALRTGLLEHEERYPYSGAERYIDAEDFLDADYRQALRGIPAIGGLQPAIVKEAAIGGLQVIAKNGERYDLKGDAIKWVRRHLPGGGAEPVLRRGAVVRLVGDGEETRVTALPGAQGAVISLSSDDGAIVAMAGGFDFLHNQFNNATQAKRQPGSAIKPFFYSAALEKGLMPASILPDAPIYLSRKETGSDEAWQPRNYDGKTAGAITLRRALSASKNLATIRLARHIGINYAVDHLSRFGFQESDHPPYLTTSLGAGAATPLEVARAYAVFANGGYLVSPYLITRVEDYDGNEIVKELDYENRQVVIDRRNAFIMTNLLQSVILEGTGRRALQLKRQDLAGKTGTTNDTRDAWFAGYGGDLTTVSWVGYAQNKSLGEEETGSRAALPVWIKFMGPALDGEPETQYPVPDGVISVEVGRESGKILAPGAAEKVRREYFYTEYLPAGESDFGGGAENPADEGLF